MTDGLHISVVGAILASVFAAGMAALLLWMLRLPRPVSLEVARAVRSVGAVRTIFVPILEEYYSERAVELASRLGQMQKATILIGYVMEVPRTLSLGVPLPQAEEAAHHALEQAKTIVGLHNLEARTEVVRSREAGEGIARVARDHDADLIVLGISPESGLVEGSTARVAESLLRHTPCEVIIDRLAETSIGAQASEPAPTPEPPRSGASSGAAPAPEGQEAARRPV